MRTPLSIVGLLACCFLLLACGGEEEDQSANNAAAGDGDTPAIRIRHPGDEPRRNLTYDLHAGQTETYVMDMRMDMTMVFGGQRQTMAMPTMRMIGPAKVTGVDDDGYTMRFTFDRVDLLEDRPIPPQMRQHLSTQLNRMEGMTMRYRMAPNGAVAEMTVENIDQLDPQMKQQLTQIQQSMKQIVVPLPDEPVGRGATWRVDQDINNGQMRLQQTVDYELTALSEQQAELTVSIAQTAPPQTIEQQGQQVQLEQMNGTGDGRITVTFGRLAPTASLNLVNQSRFTTEGREMEMDMTMQVEIYPQAPPAE